MVKLLLASLLLIGTLGKLNCATLQPRENGLERSHNLKENEDTPPDANPLLDEHRVVTVGKPSRWDILLKKERFYAPDVPKATNFRRMDFAATDNGEISQVELLLYNNSKVNSNKQTYRIQPKSLKKKPAKNADVLVYNSKGGVLADVLIYGH